MASKLLATAAAAPQPTGRRAAAGGAGAAQSPHQLPAAVTATLPECTICLSVLTANICVAPCGHTYHHACMVQWLRSGSGCPQCRAPAHARQLYRVAWAIDAPALTAAVAAAAAEAGGGGGGCSSAALPPEDNATALRELAEWHGAAGAAMNNAVRQAERYHALAAHLNDRVRTLHVEHAASTAEAEHAREECRVAGDSLAASRAREQALAHKLATSHAVQSTVSGMATLACNANHIPHLIPTTSHPAATMQAATLHQYKLETAAYLSSRAFTLSRDEHVEMLEVALGAKLAAVTELKARVEKLERALGERTATESRLSKLYTAAKDKAAGQEEYVYLLAVFGWPIYTNLQCYLHTPTLRNYRVIARMQAVQSRAVAIKHENGHLRSLLTAYGIDVPVPPRAAGDSSSSSSFRDDLPGTPPLAIHTTPPVTGAASGLPARTAAHHVLLAPPPPPAARSITGPAAAQPSFGIRAFGPPSPSPPPPRPPPPSPLSRTASVDDTISGVKRTRPVTGAAPSLVAQRRALAAVAGSSHGDVLSAADAPYDGAWVGRLVDSQPDDDADDDDAPAPSAAARGSALVRSNGGALTSAASRPSRPPSITASSGAASAQPTIGASLAYQSAAASLSAASAAW